MLSQDKIGHRARLRERLLSSKLGSLPDYEILELVLMLAKPRCDTKPLAKLLIKQFGGLAKLVHATPDKLLAISGVGESVLAAVRLMHEMGMRLSREETYSNPVVSSWSSLIDYCRSSMGHLSTEQFRILYLDAKNMIIDDMLQETGTINQTVAYPREIIKRALMLDSSAIILVHNHPSGNPKPSAADVEFTKNVEKMARDLCIHLHDHVIISPTAHFSFRSNNLID